jgi:hypothetical protein
METWTYFKILWREKFVKIVAFGLKEECLEKIENTEGKIYNVCYERPSKDEIIRLTYELSRDEKVSYSEAKKVAENLVICLTED